VELGLTFSTATAASSVNSTRSIYGIPRRSLLASLALTPLVGVHSATGTNLGKPLRIGAIGVGHRGANNIYPMETERIVAIADVDAKHLDAMKTRHPAAQTFVDYRKLLEFPELDAVIISAPNHHHALAASMAIKRGLHVYCEKPLAHNVDEVRLLRNMAAKHQGVAVMGNQHHDRPGYRAVRDIVKRGDLGDVREVHAWTAKPLWPQGHMQYEAEERPEQLDWDLWLGAAASRPFHKHCHPYHWRGWWEYGGGALGDMGPHLLDPIFRAFELKLPTKIERVQGEATVLSPPMASQLRFHFQRPDDKPLVVHWYDGTFRPDPKLANVRRLPAHGALIMGSEAVLFVPQLGKKPLLIKDGKSRQVRVETRIDEKEHQEKFVEACHGRGDTFSSFAYAADLSETCLLGNVALRLRRTIERDATSGKFSDEAEQAMGRVYRDGWCCETRK